MLFRSEEYYCTLCYATFDFKRRTVVLANSGLPYPLRCRGTHNRDAVHAPAQIELAGVPLGSFAGSTYDEQSFELAVGDLYVFCTDGISEAADSLGTEFGSGRLAEVVSASRYKTAREIVDDIFAAVQEFRSDASAVDDMTAVAVRITA